MELVPSARYFLCVSILTLGGLAGCGGEVKVPDLDQATAEQKRQEFEEMVKKERMNQ